MEPAFHDRLTVPVLGRAAAAVSGRARAAGLSPRSGASAGSRRLHEMQRSLPVSALKAERVSKRYGSVVALDRVSLEVERGECVALIGESGSGKTTLLRCFNRLTDPDEGRVLVEGEDVAAAGPDRAPPAHRVRAAGRAGCSRTGGCAATSRWCPGSRGESDEPRRTGRSRLVGLDPEQFGERWPGELSGGQRQRVAVARALAAAPDGGAARRAVRRARRDHPGRPPGDLPDPSPRARAHRLLVTHDLHEAFLLADRVAVLRGGTDRAGRAARRAPDRPATAYVRELLRRARVLPVSAALLLLLALQAVSAAGGGGLEAVRRVVPAGRDVRAAAGGARHRGGAASRPGRHRDRVSRASAPGRSTSIPSTPAPGCWRFSASGPSPIRSEVFDRVAPRVPPALERALAAAARLREHVRDRGAAGDRRALPAAHAERPGAGGGPAPGRAHRRLHRPTRRTAGADPGVRAPVLARCARCCRR